MQWKQELENSSYLTFPLNLYRYLFLISLNTCNSDKVMRKKTVLLTE